jgi:Dimerisation domain of Zinc Transporter/Cation efflux family
VAIAVAASAINLAVGLVLVRTGREHRSIALEADGKHLLTDVGTSAGVVVGVAAVAISGWERLDPIVALAVAANIVFTGMALLRRSAAGLIDSALPEEQQHAIPHETPAAFDARGIRFHALRTRQAGQRVFVSFHILVPGAWTVQRGHDMAEEVEARAARAAAPRDDLHPRRARRGPKVVRRHGARPGRPRVAVAVRRSDPVGTTDAPCTNAPMARERARPTVSPCRARPSPSDPCHRPLRQGLRSSSSTASTAAPPDVTHRHPSTLRVVE